MDPQTTQCTAMSRQAVDEHGNPKRCGQMVRGEATECKWHEHPQKRLARERRHRDDKIQNEARKLIPDKEQRTVITDPLQHLLGLAGELDAYREGLRRLVNRLDDDFRYEDERGSEQLRSEVTVYQRAMKDCTDLLAKIAQLNIEEKLARIDAMRLAAMLGFMDRVVTALGHDPQSPQVQSTYRYHLRGITA